MPSVDLRGEDDRFVLRADEPGVALADIEVSAENGASTIRGERPARKRVSSDGFEHIQMSLRKNADWGVIQISDNGRGVFPLGFAVLTATTSLEP